MRSRLERVEPFHRFSPGEPGRVGGVGVPEVQPERPVGPQDPTDFVEDSGEMLHEPFGSGLQAELAEPASALPAG